MIEKTDIEAALDECGITYAEPSFAPRKPPEQPYAVIRDRYSFDGSDYHVGMIGHDTSVYLSDGGGKAGADIRWSLACALAKRGIKFVQYPGDYDYDLKLFSSEYEIQETYYEKWSDDYV